MRRKGTSHPSTFTLALAGFLAVSLLSCRRSEDPAAGSSEPSRPRGESLEPPLATQGPLVAFLGDSLTAGYGLPESAAYPALIKQMLLEKRLAVRIVNAGVSGDTTAGGVRRVDWLLAQKPDVLVIALGANDGLRGLPVDMTEKNLREIVRKGKSGGARVLLCGLLVPPNYPPNLARTFEAIFPRIAAEESIPLVPFLLEGVAGKPDLNLPDGIHPNERGQQILARNVLAGLEPLLR